MTVVRAGAVDGSHWPWLVGIFRANRRPAGCCWPTTTDRPPISWANAFQRRCYYRRNAHRRRRRLCLGPAQSPFSPTPETGPRYIGFGSRRRATGSECPFDRRGLSVGVFCDFVVWLPPTRATC